jgi:D-psicose/D-tagatose/L-ribulose 3-epimerase
VKVAISNIAWEPRDDEAVAEVLRRYGVDAIDIAPGKYFPDPPNATASDIVRVRRDWEARGVRIHGMQALLFGTTGLNLFGEASVRAAMLDHLDAICRIGAGLGAGPLVFGSPKNRDRRGLDDAQAERVAVDFFRVLGDRAARHGVSICLEPNPERYGSNFMTTTAAAATIVERVDHPAIRLQLDAGALTINAEPVDPTIRTVAALIGHVHASEPDLVTLGDGGTDHGAVASALRASLPGATVTIEMVASAREPHIQAVERAVALAVAHYAPRGEPI